ncbi:MAG: MbnP family protein [Bacteroidota bacterium]
MTNTKLITIVVPLICLFFLLGCNNNDDTVESATVNFSFSHFWVDTPIDNTNLTSINVTNANGEIMDFTRIRYLVSRFELENINSGQYIMLNGYKFTDVSQPGTYNFIPENNEIPPGIYKLKFIWGLNEGDNIDGAYTDLNSASWNWPAMLGGGYHFMQMDGEYNLNMTPNPYNFHNGTARVSQDPPVFEPNFQTIEFSSNIEVSRDTKIDIKMDFSEFFINPHTWDLNVLDTPLMPNYTAQKMMQDNVLTVFSINSVTQE